MMGNMPSKGLFILLVEDDVLSQRMFSILCEFLGHKVDVAFNGVEGIEALRGCYYDLVFMDIRMPIMDGLEATRKIRALDEGCKNIPIIAITASDIPEEEKLCLDAGMNDHITKPLDLKRIQEILDAFKDGRYHHQENVTVDEILVESGSADVILDPKIALQNFGEDVIQYKEFIKEFLESLPHRIQVIEESLRSGDWKTAGNEAHNLRGVSASLGAFKLSALAGNLDKVIGSGDLTLVNDFVLEIRNNAKILADQVIQEFRV